MNKTGTLLLSGLILFYAGFCHGSSDEVYETAMKSLDAGDLTITLNLAEKLIHEPAKYHQLLSQYYFYAGSYTVALEQLIESGLDSPEKIRFNGYLTNLVFYHKDLVEQVTGHFRIRTTERDRFLVSYLAGPLEKIYTTLGNIFSYYPEDKILIEIYPYKDQFAVASTLGEETIERSGAIAICKYNRMMIHSPQLLPLGYRWIDTICHEYVHFLVNRITKSNCPLWFHEGVARYHDTIWRKNPPEYITPGNENILLTARKDSKLISFSRMEPSLVYLDNQEQVNLAFTEVSTAVDFITRTYPGKLQDILSRMSYMDKNESFKTVIGVDISGFETKFRSYLDGLDLKETTGAVSDKIYFDKINEVDEFVGVNVRDHIRLGDRFRKNNNFEFALAQYARALEKEPYNPVLLVRIAKTYVSLNKPELAEQKLLLCVEKNPNYVSGYELLGEYEMLIGKNKETVSVLNEAIMINPYNPFTHKNLAIAYQQLNETELAGKEYSIFEVLANDK
jgi:hypothetical protein